MSEQHKGLLLGQHTDYPDQYDASLLCPIDRAPGRSASAKSFYGFDQWTAYELSWLDGKGKPQVAIADFMFDCDSKAIIESKSFKLYLNSFNQTQFDSREAIKSCLEKDLTEASGGRMELKLYSPNEWSAMMLSELPGVCLDEMEISADKYTIDNSFLIQNKDCTDRGEYHSHLLRSLCPVTGQPDWASISIQFQGARICPEGLLKYLISYRQHQDFHEQCVERIYNDLMEQFNLEFLTVYARYVRRGGLDINPYRSSAPIAHAQHRLIRQ